MNTMTRNPDERAAEQAYIEAQSRASVQQHLTVALNHLSAARGALSNAARVIENSRGDVGEMNIVRGACGALLRKVQAMRE